VTTGDEARAETGSFDLIVNTTTVGMRHGDDVGALPLDVDALGGGTTVMDLAYGYHVTPLIAAAEAAGAPSIDGVEVLVRQGVAAFRLWTGVEPSYETMRDAALGAGT
jgi:shikimate dehydrogenase